MRPRCRGRVERGRGVVSGRLCGVNATSSWVVLVVRCRGCRTPLRGAGGRWSYRGAAAGDVDVAVDVDVVVDEDVDVAVAVAVDVNVNVAVDVDVDVGLAHQSQV